jgi:hypothetical protein
MAEEKKKKSIWSTIGSIVFALIVIGWIFGDSDYEDVGGGSKDVDSVAKIGETVKTKYFNVTVNQKGTYTTSSIGTGYSRQAATEGSMFVVVNASFENISDESRMLSGAELQITIDGKKLKFDNTTSMFGDGWCSGIDTINPMLTLTCSMAWTVPKKNGMSIVYIPPRSSTGINIGVYND